MYGIVDLDLNRIASNVRARSARPTTPPATPALMNKLKGYTYVLHMNNTVAVFGIAVEDSGVVGWLHASPGAKLYTSAPSCVSAPSFIEVGLFAVSTYLVM